LGRATSALVAEDGLADTYATFKQIFTGSGFDQQWPIGYGFHAVLSTEKINAVGHRPKGTATLVFAEHRVRATLDDAPATGSFDLWFVKNISGSGRTVKPESGDQFFKVGTFSGTTAHKELNVTIGSNINFDLDLAVVTRTGKDPTQSRIALGARTLLEKRFFREKAGKALDPVSGTLAPDVETTDALVARGAQLFFHETFGGNGRTCGTCHRAEHNLTIDPTFIATLPSSDPLFVAETNPLLANLEVPALMRERGLILENLEGFDDLSRFVLRSVQHTFALGTSNSIRTAIIEVFPDNPPAHRLGWSGDAPPGRGTLHEFGIGAINQHFPKTLARKAGTDFRIPTQEELDALESFQLFTGRQKLVDASLLVFREARANNGSSQFFTQGCDACHRDTRANPENPNFATGVAQLVPDLPFDDGFLTDLELDQGGKFNPPVLIEAADTAPFFHNNAKADIESAVGFYASQEFLDSPEGNNFNFILPPETQADIGAFLRVLNAAENVRQVRKRAKFVRDHRGTGNTDILTLAIADTEDALLVLSAKGLNPAAQNALQDVRLSLFIARANADSDRPAFMDHVLVYLDIVKADLFTSNPNNDF
jgi:hypothetical protein